MSKVVFKRSLTPWLTRKTNSFQQARKEKKKASSATKLLSVSQWPNATTVMTYKWKGTLQEMCFQTLTHSFQTKKRNFYCHNQSLCLEIIAIDDCQDQKSAISQSDFFALLPLNKLGHSSTSSSVQVSPGMSEQSNNSMVPRPLIQTATGCSFIQGAPRSIYTNHIC